MAAGVERLFEGEPGVGSEAVDPCHKMGTLMPR
jgi:hypothetical protein